MTESVTEMCYRVVLGKTQEISRQERGFNCTGKRDSLKFEQEMRYYFGVFVQNSANRTMMFHVKEKCQLKVK